VTGVVSPEADQPRGQTAEDRLRIWRQEQAQASPSPTPSLVEIEQGTKELELERPKTAVTSS